MGATNDTATDALEIAIEKWSDIGADRENHISS